MTLQVIFAEHGFYPTTFDNGAKAYRKDIDPEGYRVLVEDYAALPDGLMTQCSACIEDVNGHIVFEIDALFPYELLRYSEQLLERARRLAERDEHRAQYASLTAALADRRRTTGSPDIDTEFAGMIADDMRRDVEADGVTMAATDWNTLDSLCDANTLGGQDIDAHPIWSPPYATRAGHFTLRGEVVLDEARHMLAEALPAMHMRDFDAFRASRVWVQTPDGACGYCYAGTHAEAERLGDLYEGTLAIEYVPEARANIQAGEYYLIVENTERHTTDLRDLEWDLYRFAALSGNAAPELGAPLAEAPRSHRAVAPDGAGPETVAALTTVQSRDPQQPQTAEEIADLFLQFLDREMPSLGRDLQNSGEALHADLADTLRRHGVGR